MRKTVISLLSVLLAVGIVVCFSECSNDQKTQGNAGTQAYWPADNWRTSTPEEQGMDSAVLADMIDAIKQSGKSINSVSIIRNGSMVNEAYFYPYQKGMKHSLNSCTKSFISALTGIALNEGSIKSVDDKVISYFPDLNIANVDARKQTLTVRNLLDMTTGLDWKFVGDVSTGQMIQSPNWTKFTLDLPMKEDPGLTFNYCNGAANVTASIIQKATNESPAQLAADKFKVLGIRDMYWSTTPENVSTGYSGIYMNPDDMAKFGYLYLKKGNWMGQQIVPESWIEESTKIQSKPDWTPIFPGYGYMWWIPRFGGYAAMGYGGNYIFVVPSLNMVAVFTGGIFNNADLFYPAELMEKYIIPSVKSDAPLPSNQQAHEALDKAVDAVQKAPAPQPVSPLPDTAKTISGRPFKMEDGTIVTLTFKEGNSEFTFDLDGKIKFPVGLDGQYRDAAAGNTSGGMPDHNHTAFIGRWLDTNTLQVIGQNLEDGFITTYEVHIENGNIEVKMHTNLGMEQTSKATFVE